MLTTGDLRLTTALSRRGNLRNVVQRSERVETGEEEQRARQSRDGGGEGQERAIGGG